MKIIYGIKKIKKFAKPVVAMGVFDGVHRAHRRILRQAAAKARAVGGTSITLTFWPHPQGEPTLYSLAHRLKLIAEQGIGVCAVISFNRVFARISADDFIKDILARKIGARYIYVGANFRFGRGAAGDCGMLRRYASVYDYQVKCFSVIKSGGSFISSSVIRKLIFSGKLKQAERLLSRPVNVLGTVVKGTSLAAKLGFPTANIDPHHEVLPPHGIYAVRVILGNKKYGGACYIGKRPSVLRQKEKNIEVHIFGFRRNIYAKDLEVQFISKIRNEKRFASLAHLAAQIYRDTLSAKKVLSRL